MNKNNSSFVLASALLLITVSSSNCQSQTWKVPSEQGVQAIAADGFGNVIVAGCSSNGTSGGIIIKKFDSGGSLVWSNRFDGTNGGADIPNALTIDDAGSIFVVGSSSNRLKSVTLKFDATGDLDWKAKCNGYAVGVVVDKVGNVYVNGTSQTTNVYDDFELFTLKYNDFGHGVWTNRMGIGCQEGWPGFGLDAIGNVYVAGVFESWDDTYDGFVVKYDSNGQGVWTNYTFRENYPYAATVDKYGNTYVTGNNLTVKLDAAGNACWSRLFPGFYIAVDPIGNVIVSNSQTVKYDCNGMLLWSRDVGGEHFEDIHSLVTDESGNIYLTFDWVHVHEEHSERFYGASLSAYSPLGATNWVKSFVSIQGFAVNQAGTVFVAETTRAFEAGTAEDAIELSKYQQSYAPPLSLMPISQMFVLQWPALATNVVLEVSSDLSTPSNWHAVTNPPIIVGSKNVVTNDMESMEQFFRLRAK